MLDKMGWNRRRLLRAGAGSALALGSGLLPGVGMAGSAIQDKEGGGSSVTVLRWLDGARVPSIRHLRPGWMEPCASLASRVCPVPLNDLVDAAPVRKWTVPKRFDVRLLGYDGQSPLGSHSLDLWYPADGASSLVPFRMAEVRRNRLQGASATARAWTWDGRLVLQVGMGADSRSPAVTVEVPAEPGLFLVVLKPAALNLDPAAWAFAEGKGGPFHRRLQDLYGNAPKQFGYFALSLAEPV